MFIRENPYVFILCVTAIISSCVALTAWTRREVAPATRPFTGLMVAIAAYAITAAGSDSVSTAQSLVAWATLEYVASNCVIALYLTFTLFFTGQKYWLVPWRKILLWMIPIFNVVLVASNHWHQMVWTEIVIHPENSYLNVVYHGKGYYWIAACFYTYVVTGSLLVIRSAILSSSLYRKQACVVIAASLPPLVAGTLYSLGISPRHLNILPMSFLLTGLVYFWSLFRFRLFDLLPIARDTLIERMSDGVVVVNRDNRV
ncbi:MAG: histidine kinase N-terminal 7TM domain-containing protein, partial [Cyanobacteria bacterium J06632_3]